MIEVQLISQLPGIPTPARFKKWIAAALTPAQLQAAEITLRVVNATEAQALNGDFRGKDYATNVLTFVYHAPGSRKLCGDIVLCAPVVAREARAQHKTKLAHYAHLTVHGVLHLAGLDHENDRDAKRMENREIRILRSLGFNDPYIA